MSTWVFSQIGAREHFALPRAAARAGRLERLYTDLWTPAWLAAWLRGPRLAQALAARRHDEIDVARVSARTLSTLARAAWRRRPGATPARCTHAEYLRDGRDFATWVLAQMQAGPSIGEHAFFGYNTGSLETLDGLRGQGVFTVVGQIDPARTEHQLVLAEHADWPGWAREAPPVPERYWERMRAEWDAAECVLVNSNWSRRAVVEQGADADKVVVAPLAFERTRTIRSAPASSATPGDGPLKVLFLGQVSLRKGIQYLLAAAARLADVPVEIQVAGPIDILDERVRTAPRNVRFTGPVARARASELYAGAHVFVLPTISDGFALTQLEAMAHGLPVIATDACGEVVDDGVDGWRVPAGDADALAAAIAACAADRAGARAMGVRAIDKAARFPLSRPLAVLDAARERWVRGEAPSACAVQS